MSGLESLTFFSAESRSRFLSSFQPSQLGRRYGNASREGRKTKANPEYPVNPV